MNSRTNEISPWRFVIAGPDQDGHAAEVMARARAAGVEDDVEMIGPVFGQDKDNLYAKADLFVLPSYSENFGVVVIEALAHGCPVITTKETPWSELHGEGSNAADAAGSRAQTRLTPLVQGMPEGLVHDDVTKRSTSPVTLHPASFAANGRCGWWVDVGVEPLAEALREAMSLSDKERFAMGENGRRLVDAKYTWPAIAEQMKAAYVWILNGGDVPPSVALK